MNSTKSEYCLTYESEWSTVESTSVRGSGFVAGECYSTERLCTFFEGANSTRELVDKLRSVNGFFALITEVDGDLVLATDRIQSIPLFYTNSTDGVLVGTDSSQIVDRVGRSNRDPVHEAEYIVTGYVTGRDTLFDDIYQVQAGEFVVLSEDASAPAHREQYYRYRHETPRESTTRELLSDLDDVLVAAFSRLIDYADGRPIVLNMSAGYDSRLLATMLARLEYENTIAFTYEYSGDESKYCEEIADSLGLEWVYVTQDHDEWREWYHSDKRVELDRNAGIIDAVPTIGPAIALKKLSEDGRVPEDSVFVTGDAASTTGDHIPASLIDANNGSLEQYIDSILSNHYELFEWSSEFDEVFRDRIVRATDIDGLSTRDDVIDAFELWDWQERQAKHILRNGLFDFWGYDWWHPLWDTEFVNFWLTVAPEHRYDRSLYERYTKELYADVADRSISEVETSFHERSSWVRKIERVLTGTPLKDPVERIYREYMSPRTYDGNPIWGIMSRDQFDEIHSGRQVIHTFRILNVLGRLSLEPRGDGCTFKNGICLSDIENNLFDN
ncbi:hypothetical protein [Halomarina ordinaria]|uniref:Asparagine synthase n=1 Tax=Halomarina ordinaria TaxID=3033939 RepID=A0ABD5U3I7_9EURY|nr:hypothetical protein [Halomarina sp. PSRA2]